MSFDVLQDKIRLMKNPTVAGLDARIEYVPEHIRKAAYEQYGVGLKGAAEAIWQFNVALIDAMCDIVPAVKPQAAYYENLGWQGMEMLERTIAYAKEKGADVIALTDSPIAPIADYADHLLLAQSDMASFVDSLVAPLSIINAIIVAVARKNQDALTQRLRRLEEIWDEYEVYDQNLS